ncbi:50S ribosomal protein L24 [uncultured archaeon]|nr:50S ribosomal protein L24 [uncultured archaeon]
MLKTSEKPRQQRKFRYTAPLHLRTHFVHVHLSKDLRAKMKKRAIAVKKGDKVKVMRGKFAGKEGKIMSVNLTRAKVFIEGMAAKKQKGKEVPLAFEPSNLMITEMTERK